MEINRRKFLKITALGGVVALLPSAQHQPDRYEQEEISWLYNPERYTFLTRDTATEAWAGNLVNTPNLHKLSFEEQRPYIEQIALVASNARSILNNNLEPKRFGDYEDRVLDDHRKLADHLDRYNLGFHDDFIDMYNLRDSFVIFFGGNKADSIYGYEGETAFYEKRFYREKMLFRIDHVSRRIGNIPNLTAVSIANEPKPPQIDGGFGLFNDWLQEMTTAARNSLPDRVAVLPGVADPRFVSDEVKGLTANTFHSYKWANNYAGLTDYMASSRRDILVQEFGEPTAIKHIPFTFRPDLRWFKFFKENLGMFTIVDNESNRVDLSALVGFGAWKTDPEKDGHNFNVFELPVTADAMRRLNKLLSNA